MALMRVTSPHTHNRQTTGQVMQLVLLATLPGVLALTFVFGWGTLINILLAVVFAIALEASALKLRRRPVKFYLNDYTAIVTAVLLAIALPPYSSWWVILVGIFFSIIVAKQLYGGLGYNPFNPAMVGYVALLISFPVAMTAWPTPIHLTPDTVTAPNLFDALLIGLTVIERPMIDGFTMATPLDLVRQNDSLLLNDLMNEYPQFGRWSGYGWEWANLGFLVGGLFLLQRKIFTWHTPVSMLLAIAIMSALFYDGGSSNSAGSPLFHLLGGATMFGAWFIATDPVSSAVSNKGRIIYGAGIGVLTFIIRKWGNYPDAVAFAVLLMNFSAPLIDHYTQTKPYGHNNSK
jgi:electron transport complex protein RnfD